MNKFNFDDLEMVFDTPDVDFKLCTKCNTKNLLNAKFCIECGNKTFKDANSVTRYCKDCQIKLDDDDDTCPICGGSNFVGSIDDLIQDKLKYSHAFLDKNKELKEKFERKNLVLSDYKKEIKRLEKCVDAYTDDYINIKNDVEKLKKQNEEKVSQLKKLIEDAKRDAGLILSERDKEMALYHSLKKKYEDMEKLLITVEEEYETLITEKNKAYDELKNHIFELSKKEEKNKEYSKSFSNEFNEFETAVYASLAHYYFDKEPNKCFKYATKGYAIDDECLAYVVLVVNDPINRFSEEIIKKWNELAYKYFHHDENSLENICLLAYSTLISIPGSRYYNKDKCLSNIRKNKNSMFISQYYQCLCLERVEQYGELKNELARISGEIKKLYLEQRKVVLNNLFAPIVKRVEER